MTIKYARDIRSKGFIDAITHKDRTAVVTDAFGLVVQRILFGEADEKGKVGGEGDISLLVYLDRIVRKTVKSNSKIAKVWPDAMRALQDFVELNNSLEPVGCVGGVDWKSVKMLDETNRKNAAYWSGQFEELLNSVPKAERKVKTDEEKFLELAVTLNLDIEKVKALLPMPEVSEEISEAA